MSGKKDKVDKASRLRSERSASPFAALKEMKDRMEKEAEAKKKPAAPAPLPPKNAAAKKAQSAAQHDEDVESFHRMMMGVAPMPTNKPQRAGAEPTKNLRADEIKSRAEQEAAEARERLASLAMGGLSFEVTDDGKHMEGKRADAPSELLRKLRRGVLPVDVTLDLHGQRAAEAEESIFAFLTKARTAGERVARIIHGKGNHSPGHTGVLRGELGAWLSQGRSSRFVMAFATCPTEDGSEGATLVALTR